MYIVTGKTGTPHVTGADDAAFNAGVVGAGNYVIGEKELTATAAGMAVHLSACEILIEGIHARCEGTESLAIGNGGQGEKRIDLIIAEWTVDVGTGIESVTPKVIKGTPVVSGEPAAPAVISSDTVKQMELARVRLDGAAISSVSVTATHVPSLATVANDTGWIAPAFENGYSQYTAEPLMYRKIGDVVYLKGLFAAPAASGRSKNVFMFPEGFRPVKGWYVPVTITGNGRVANVSFSEATNYFKFEGAYLGSTQVTEALQWIAVNVSYPVG